MSDPRKKIIPIVLLLVIGVIAYAAFREGTQWLRNKAKAAETAAASAPLPAAQPAVNQRAPSQDDKLRKLAEHEAKIPLLDGYIAVSRVVGEKRPGLKVYVDPPQLRHGTAILPANYSTGLFRIRGSGTLEHVRSLLQTIEVNLPFSHAQELHCSFPAGLEGDVNFTLSLLVALRSNEESPTASALAWQRRTD